MSGISNSFNMNNRISPRIVTNISYPKEESEY